MSEQHQAVVHLCGQAQAILQHCPNPHEKLAMAFQGQCENDHQKTLTLLVDVMIECCDSL